MIAKGEPWGGPAGGPPQVVARGGDADLAALAARPGPRRVRFCPDATCDLARALGLTAEAPGTTELPVDVLELDGRTVANVAVLGPAPDRLGRRHRARPLSVQVDGRTVFDGRATTVVVANGEFLRGLDLVPRGHPGDGRLEVHVYALHPAERAAMRRRLGHGGHLPHPRIATFTGRTVVVVAGHALGGEADGRPLPASSRHEGRIRPGALRLLV